MSFCICMGRTKQLSLLIALLLPSLVLQAESSDVSTVKFEEAINTVHITQQRNYQYPKWPVRLQVSRVLVPPPPLGPYMSLAFNDFSVNKSSFAGNSKQYTSNEDLSNVPMEVFSPDVPWPENLSSANRWMPEYGYHYVQPQAVKKSYQVTQNNSPSNYGPRYRKKFNMNGPDSR